jgi:hypothetical protein
MHPASYRDHLDREPAARRSTGARLRRGRHRIGEHHVPGPRCVARRDRRWAWRPVQPERRGRAEPDHRRRLPAWASSRGWVGGRPGHRLSAVPAGRLDVRCHDQPVGVVAPARRRVDASAAFPGSRRTGCCPGAGHSAWVPGLAAPRRTARRQLPPALQAPSTPARRAPHSRGVALWAGPRRPGRLRPTVPGHCRARTLRPLKTLHRSKTPRVGPSPGRAWILLDRGWRGLLPTPRSWRPSSRRPWRRAPPSPRRPPSTHRPSARRGGARRAPQPSTRPT